MRNRQKVARSIIMICNFDDNIIEIIYAEIPTTKRERKSISAKEKHQTQQTK